MEKVRHDDLGPESACQDVCTLLSLRPEAKDVVDGDEGAAGVLGTCDVYLWETSKSFEGSLGLIGSQDGGNGAAGGIGVVDSGHIAVEVMEKCSQAEHSFNESAIYK